MLIATFFATGAQPKVLAKTSRDFMEMNFRVNHRPILQVQDFLRAEYAEAYPRGNRRNIVTFSAYRGLNEAQQEFKDAEEAAIFMIDHGPSIGDDGILQLEFKGQFTNAIRYFENAVFAGCEPIEDIGVTIGFAYEFNCGIAKTALPTP